MLDAELDKFHGTKDIFESYPPGYVVLRPRRYEVAMALSRMQGMEFEVLPSKLDRSKEEKEEEERRNALTRLWNLRRKKRPV